MPELTPLDILAHATNGPGDRLCRAIFLIVGEDPPEIARLSIIIAVSGIMAIAHHIPRRQPRIAVFRRFFRGIAVTVRVK